jgi:bifunctional UDP-N-acetylglucosamine pyrophosphorylase / glucosamine-1-phosphate N-acetyltransferase
MNRDFRARTIARLTESGVLFEDPGSVYFADDVSIGPGTKVGPNTQFRGKTRIGSDCRIDGSAVLADAEIGDRVHVKFSVVIAESVVGDECSIGPFANLRPGTRLERGVTIGNFVETKKATIGENTKASHLTYLGDATIGRDTNIGAGTITCNYDGFQKSQTVIGDRVQVGSDSTLVAPIRLGDDVYVATATTVRSDVPSGALVFNERREQVRDGWTERKREKMRGHVKH